MPNLAAHAALATDDGFRRRMQASLVQLAASVAGNANAPKDQKRLAADVLTQPMVYVDRYAWQVAGATAMLQAFSNAGSNVAEMADAPIDTEVQKAMVAVLANTAAAV